MSVRSAQRVRDFILRFACASEMSISGRVYIYRNGKYLSFASFFGITIIYKNIMSMGFCCKRLVAIQLHLFHNSNHFWLIYSITMESFLFYDSFPIRLSGNTYFHFFLFKSICFMGPHMHTAAFENVVHLWNLIFIWNVFWILEMIQLNIFGLFSCILNFKYHMRIFGI